MSRSEKAIFTCMCMVENPDGSILVQDRSSEDWLATFPGGHVEKGDPLLKPPYGRCTRKPALR